MLSLNNYRALEPEFHRRGYSWTTGERLAVCGHRAYAVHRITGDCFACHRSNSPALEELAPMADQYSPADDNLAGNLEQPNSQGQHTQQPDTSNRDGNQKNTQTQDQGTVTADTAGGDSPAADDPARPREAKVDVKRRLQDEGRWYGQVELKRDEMMRLARKQGMGKLDAQQWTYSELDRLYPPLPPPDPGSRPNLDNSSPAEGRVQGLTPPESWGVLPLNASLAAELGWVQAHRLSVVEELPGGATVVHLDRAREPAPSLAALGWLETSIRSYAKYVDIVARSLSTAQDEREHQRRERMRIEEIERLIAEMEDAGKK